MIYVAYGSNMHRDGMSKRCPGARALGVTMLKGQAIGVKRDGFVAIRPRRGHVVHGLAWQVSLRDVVALDRYEHAGTQTYRRRLLAVRLAGRTVRAWVYCGSSRVDTGRLRRDYFIQSVLGPALSWGLPGPYVAELGRLARSGFRS
jgi:gamma-glutamylcyclotransferase (GGCT)/AIG2-like uncharacterized protein YtfP